MRYTINRSGSAEILLIVRTASWDSKDLFVLAKQIWDWDLIEI